MKMRFFLITALWTLGVPFARGEPGVISPLAEACGPSSGHVVCINKYGAVMPYHFFRNDSSNDNKIPYGGTEVPEDKSFSQVAKADFVVFDKKRGLGLLGSNPSYSFVFNVSEAVHEAPVYAPAQNKLYISQLAPPPGYLPQLVIDLNQDPPTIDEFISDPPVYAPNGGTFREGLVVWGASGGNNSIGGGEQRVSIRTLNPATNKTTTLLNNYFGSYFNTIDDLSVHPKTGDIWFTDPDYSWFNALTDTAPQLPVASYRFVPSTGATYVVSDDLYQPNGIAFTPDGKHLYISDTGAVTGTIDGRLGSQGSQFNATGIRTIYKYDVSPDGTYIYAKRPIYLSQDWVPDGLKVAANGYVLTGAGYGVDILDPIGTPLVRIQTNYTVQNFAWTGKGLTTLWIMGNGGVSKVEWNLKGPVLK